MRTRYPSQFAFGPASAGLVLALTLAACGGDEGGAAAPPPEGAASPEALVGRMRTAVEDEDWADFVYCIVPEDRPLMNLGAYMGAATIAAFSAMGDPEKAQALKNELEAIADKYDLDEVEQGSGPLDPNDREAMVALANEGFANVDHAAFFSDMLKFMIGHSDEGSARFTSKFTGELRDLVIEGDRATARLGEQDFSFARVDGRWFAEMPN
ncbi:MAG: hypothetical protein ACYTG6_12325 [Planctomycetota bacterium]